MTCRGMNLESDIDNVLNSDEEAIEATLKKYMATKNCKKDSALRWALQRSTSAEQRAKVERILKSYYESEEGLL